MRIVETGRGTLIWFKNVFHLFLYVTVVGLCGRVTSLNRTERWGVKVVDNFLRFLVNKLYLTKTRKKTALVRNNSKYNNIKVKFQQSSCE